MLNILASGTLVSDPKSRQSATGKAYTTASMRVPTEDGEAMLASLIAFNADAVASILALSKGDCLSVAGRAKLSEWAGQDGVEKRGLSVVADQVLTVYQIEKKRRQASQSAEGVATA